jgi:hypothetical protein
MPKQKFKLLKRADLGFIFPILFFIAIVFGIREAISYYLWVNLDKSPPTSTYEGFKVVKDLQVGDRLYVENNGKLQPEAISKIAEIYSPQSVFNLQVQQSPYTFFANDFAVHNKDIGCGAGIDINPAGITDLNNVNRFDVSFNNISDDEGKYTVRFGWSLTDLAHGFDCDDREVTYCTSLTNNYRVGNQDYNGNQHGACTIWGSCYEGFWNSSEPLSVHPIYWQSKAAQSGAICQDRCPFPHALISSDTNPTYASNSIVISVTPEERIWFMVYTDLPHDTGTGGMQLGENKRLHDTTGGDTNRLVYKEDIGTINSAGSNFLHDCFMVSNADLLNRGKNNDIIISCKAPAVTGDFSATFSTKKNCDLLYSYKVIPPHINIGGKVVSAQDNTIPISNLKVTVLNGQGNSVDKYTDSLGNYLAPNFNIVYRDVSYAVRPGNPSFPFVLPPIPASYENQTLASGCGTNCDFEFNRITPISRESCPSGEILDNPDFTATASWGQWQNGSTTSFIADNGGFAIIDAVNDGSAKGCWSQNIQNTGGIYTMKRLRVLGSLWKDTSIANNPYVGINIRKTDGSWIYNYPNGTIYPLGVQSSSFDTIGGEATIPSGITVIQPYFCIWNASAPSRSVSDWMSLCNISNPDYSMSANPTTRTVDKGNQTTYQITYTPREGFNSTISPGILTCPTGSTCSLTTNQGSSLNPLNSVASQTLTVTTSATTPATTYSIRVLVDSLHFVDVSLRVLSPISCAPAPNAFTLLPGGTSASISANASGDLIGTGYTYSWGSVGVWSSQTGAATTWTAKNAIGANLPLDVYTLAVAVTDNGSSSRTRSCQVTATVANFSVGVSPASQNINQGSSKDYTATFTNLGNWTTAIIPTCSVPAGATGATCQIRTDASNPESFIPATAPGTTRTVTVTAGATTPIGTYTLTITIIGDSNHQATASFVVGVGTSPNYAITVTPSTRSIDKGGNTTYTANFTANSQWVGTITPTCEIYQGATKITANVSCSLSTPATFTPAVSSGTDRTVTVNTTADIPAGTYTVKIIGDLSHEASALLTVLAPISCAPAFTLLPGDSTVITNAFTLLPGGTSASISANASGDLIGTGYTYSWGSVGVWSSQTGAATTWTAKNAIGANLPLDVYTLAVAVTDNGSSSRTRSCQVTATVANFSVGVSPASQNINQGSSKDYTATFTNLGNWTTAIIPTCSVPAGATGATCQIRTDASNPESFIPATAPGTTRTVTVTAGATTPIGTYTLTITIIGDSNHQATASFVVNNIPVGAVSGKIYYQGDPFSCDKSGAGPVKDVTVRAEARVGGFSKEQKTASDGRYSLDNLNVGDYTVNITIPADLNLTARTDCGGSSKSITIPSAGGNISDVDFILNDIVPAKWIGVYGGDVNSGNSISLDGIPAGKAMILERDKIDIFDPTSKYSTENMDEGFVSVKSLSGIVRAQIRHGDQRSGWTQVDKTEFANFPSSYLTQFAKSIELATDAPDFSKDLTSGIIYMLSGTSIGNITYKGRDDELIVIVSSNNLTFDGNFKTHNKTPFKHPLVLLVDGSITIEKAVTNIDATLVATGDIVIKSNSIRDQEKRLTIYGGLYSSGKITIERDLDMVAGENNNNPVVVVVYNPSSLVSDWPLDFKQIRTSWREL